MERHVKPPSVNARRHGAGGGGSGREPRGLSSRTRRARSFSRARGICGHDNKSVPLSPNDKGDLPPGVHAAGWTEIEQLFGKANEARARFRYAEASIRVGNAHWRAEEFLRVRQLCFSTAAAARCGRS